MDVQNTDVYKSEMSVRKIYPWEGISRKKKKTTGTNYKHGIEYHLMTYHFYPGSCMNEEILLCATKIRQKR